MNCPICGKEMEPGYIQGERSMSWITKPNRLIPRQRYDEFYLPVLPASFTGLGTLSYMDAFICKGCKKIVIDYSEEPEKQVEEP